MYGIVYSVTNNKNGKRYIGQTIHTLQHRKIEHINKAKRGDGFYFHSSLRKYNFDFTWETLVVSSSKGELNKLEKYYITKYDTFNNDTKGYNLTPGGEGNEKYLYSNEQIEFVLNKRREFRGVKEILILFNEHFKSKIRNVHSIKRIIERFLLINEEKEIKFKIKSNSSKQRVETEISKYNRSLAQQGKKRKPEVIERIREKKKGFKHSTKSREYMKQVHPRTIKFTIEQENYILENIKKISKERIRQGLNKCFNLNIHTECPITRFLKTNTAK